MANLDLRSSFRRLRAFGTFWIASQTSRHLHRIRLHELEVALPLLPVGCAVLEIGAGTGWQAKQLSKLGYLVQAIDIKSSNYRDQQVWRVKTYDGKTIPFNDNSFDVVFSSNSLEHIPHIEAFQAEIHRVLRPNGIAVHILPSATWRFWTCLTEAIKNWRLPLRHGEHAPNAISEISYFHRSWWRHLFERTGWVVIHCESNGLFYTGCSIADDRLSISKRATLSRFFGGSCNIFALQADVPSSKYGPGQVGVVSPAARVCQRPG